MADSTSPDQWRRCSSCKKPIVFESLYWVCNVSTCNRKNASFVFCTVSCWDAHLGVVRHRESWAEEQHAPSRSQAAAAAVTSDAVQSQASSETPSSERPPREAKRTIPTSQPGRRTSSPPRDDVPIDTLIVMSKLKAYVKAKSGLNTSDRVLRPLSDAVRRLCDEAIEEAIASERKTLLDRDFEK
jgi:hypothetical protein